MLVGLLGSASLDRLVAQDGLLAVGLLVAGESLGIPLPGETVLVTAALVAATSHSLSIVAVVVIAAIAAIVGDNIGYLIGSAGGYRLARRYGHYVRLDEANLKVGHYLFERHGGKVVFFGRFVAVLRAYAAFLAGTTRMRYRRFLLYNALGGICWAALYGIGAYELGSAVNGLSRTLEYVVIVAAVVAIVGGIVLTRRQGAALRARAEAAYPGPLDQYLDGRQTSSSSATL